MAAHLLRFGHIVDHAPCADRARARAVAGQMHFVQLEVGAAES